MDPDSQMSWQVASESNFKRWCLKELKKYSKPVGNGTNSGRIWRGHKIYADVVEVKHFNKKDLLKIMQSVSNISPWTCLSFFQAENINVESINYRWYISEPLKNSECYLILEWAEAHSLSVSQKSWNRKPLSTGHIRVTKALLPYHTGPAWPGSTGLVCWIIAMTVFFGIMQIFAGRLAPVFNQVKWPEMEQSGIRVHCSVRRGIHLSWEKKLRKTNGDHTGLQALSCP